MGQAVDHRRQPFDLPNTVAALAILGYTTPSGGSVAYRRDVLANIGDPQTFAEAGQPFFWENRSAAGKGDALHVAVIVNAGGTWAWQVLFRFGGI